MHSAITHSTEKIYNSILESCKGNPHKVANTKFYVQITIGEPLWVELLVST